MSYKPHPKRMGKRTQKKTFRRRHGLPARGVGARGIGQGDVITASTDVCVPIWAALILGGIAAYGAVKAVSK